LDKFPPSSYLKLLKAEVKKRKPLFKKKGPETIYIGGGTPLYPDTVFLKDFLSFVKDSFVSDGLEEFSIESIPAAITPEKASILADAGINRVTIGVQSLNQDVLHWTGRKDTIEDIKNTVVYLRDAGINNIGVDVIVGLPGEGGKSFSAGIDSLLELGIQHFSAYMLKVEKETKLANLLSQKKLILADDIRFRRMFQHLSVTLKIAGYRQYEVSNFALPGFHSRHNTAIWDYQTYAGFGVAAVSFDHETRMVNPINFEDYRNYIESGELKNVKSEVIGHIQRINEKIMLGLRTITGLKCQELKIDEGFDIQVSKQKEIQEFIQKKWLIMEKGFIRTTVLGRFWLDSILVALFC